MPANGAVLGAGQKQVLKVTFTPNDTADYTTATASVLIKVNQASQSITFKPTSPVLMWGSFFTPCSSR